MLIDLKSCVSFPCHDMIFTVNPWPISQIPCITRIISYHSISQVGTILFGLDTARNCVCPLVRLMLRHAASCLLAIYGDACSARTVLQYDPEILSDLLLSIFNPNSADLLGTPPHPSPPSHPKDFLGMAESGSSPSFSAGEDDIRLLRLGMALLTEDGGGGMVGSDSRVSEIRLTTRVLSYLGAISCRMPSVLSACKDSGRGKYGYFIHIFSFKRHAF